MFYYSSLAQDILKSLSLSLLPSSEAWRKKQKAFWYNVNIEQTNFMRFTFSIKSTGCVVHRLKSLFLIQAMDLFFWGAQKQLFPDVLANRCFLRFLKTSQENTCVGGVFLNKVTDLQTPTQVISCEITQIFNNILFYRTPPMAACGNRHTTLKY